MNGYNRIHRGAGNERSLHRHASIGHVRGGRRRLMRRSVSTAPAGERTVPINDFYAPMARIPRRKTCLNHGRSIVGVRSAGQCVLREIAVSESARSRRI